MTIRLLGRRSGLLFGGKSFSPTDIAGLQLWLRADVGVFQDAALTTPATADSDPIGGWADQSGNSRHVTQSTASKRPTLKLAQQNGKPSLQFDNVDDGLVYPSFPLSDTGFSVFVVAKLTSAGSFPIWLSYGATTSGDWNMRCVSATGRPSIVEGAINSGAGETAGTGATGTTTSMTGAGFQLIEGHVSAGDLWDIWQQGTSRNQSSVGFPLSASRDLTVGYRSDGFFLPGHEAEILIYNPVLSTSNAALMRASINKRWAVY